LDKAIHDISLSLKSDQPAWPGAPPFSCESISAIKNGDSCNVSCLRMSSHFCTHLDAPYHFIENGAKLDAIPLQTLIGKALVHEVSATKSIGQANLPDLTNVERILFKTPNSAIIADSIFHEEYVSVGLDAAKAMVRAGIRLIGVDYFSIEQFHTSNYPVHHELCGNGVILVEGLDLRAISPGWYELIVLPLKIAGSDGSPCRAVLREL
jgi:arylformamidase